MSSHNTSIPSTNWSKSSVQDIENVDEQTSRRHIQIGNTPSSTWPPRILDLVVAADGPRLESIEVELVDWDGPNDPENPFVYRCPLLFSSVEERTLR